MAYNITSVKKNGNVLFFISGAKEAKGKVITFLDAHCECTAGWLEPLLYEIHKDRYVWQRSGGWRVDTLKGYRTEYVMYTLAVVSVAQWSEMFDQLPRCWFDLKTQQIHF